MSVPTRGGQMKGKAMSPSDQSDLKRLVGLVAQPEFAEKNGKVRRQGSLNENF